MAGYESKWTETGNQAIEHNIYSDYSGIEEIFIEVFIMERKHTYIKDY